MNAVAQVVSDTHKFDCGLTNIRHNDVHRLDIPEHIIFRLCILVYKCLHDMAPPYLSELFQDVDYQHRADGPSPAPARQHGTLSRIV